ncbi:DUF2062 domain-containing protein [Oceanobacter sp. 5_MG-2023]|uniref:DUF2062 domain-containing protein n=1 Tax=Oceanobacter sp. 5_MG-2023 TaxID=3062645 RepID=UPI0026E1846C|nr:DUF2062 domain-containing protein [Oceanobacter sp. 5_MG-2023]MDO6681182.1 DUF2062 domain-containing protein [Oceanobacter sp. 5_MG-2023]
MPKKLLKRIFPTPEQVQTNKSLQFLSPLFAKPNLWHLNRRSVARAFLVGLFAAFLPLPFQMGIAALIAFYANANMPISVGLVWISNPLTIPPIFYTTYLFGTWILNTPSREFHIELSLDWVLTELTQVWEPLIVGSLTTGIVLGVASYFIVDWSWRKHVWDNWKKRAARVPKVVKEVVTGHHEHHNQSPEQDSDDRRNSNDQS